MSHRAHLRVAVLALVLTGCGPITYVRQVRGAADAVDEARAARAETYAPYWWTRATAYLHKARELAAEADFQAANRYSRIATEAAHQATADARVAAKDPQQRPLDMPTEVAPAKTIEDVEPAPAKPVAPAKPAKPVAPAKEDNPYLTPTAPAKDKP